MGHSMDKTSLRLRPRNPRVVRRLTHADDDLKGRRPGGFFWFTPQGVLLGAGEAFRAKFQAAPRFGFAQCAGGA
jgi:hypothetical protein